MSEQYEAVKLSRALSSGDTTYMGQVLQTDAQMMSQNTFQLMLQDANNMGQQRGSQSQLELVQGYNGLPSVDIITPGYQPIEIPLSPFADYDQPGYGPAPEYQQPEYQQQAPQEYYPAPVPQYAPPPFEGDPRYEPQQGNCGASTALGIGLGAAIGALVAGNRSRGAGAVVGGLAGGAIATGECP